MSRSSLLATTALLAALFVLPVAYAATDGRTTGTAPAMTAVDQDLADMKALGDQAGRLKTETEAALNALREKQANLEIILRDVKGARQFTDDMIRLLQDTANQLAPNASYMSTLQTQLDLVRKLASEAQASPNPADHPFAETFNNQADRIGAIIAEGRDLGARLVAQIDQLNKVRSQIGYAYAARRTDEFIKTAREYLDVARGVLAGAASLADKTNAFNAPNVPSQ
jgi:septal ring factor EnvC (AmiA/AmiB activator)